MMHVHCAKATRWGLIPVLLAAVGLVACGGDPDITKPDKPPTPTPAPVVVRPETCAAMAGSNPIQVKVLLLIYNPTSGPTYGHRKLQQVFRGFPNVNDLLQQYVTDMVDAGGGAFCIDVVERYDLDELPPANPERVVAPDGELLIANHHWVSTDAYFHNVEHFYGSGPRVGFVDLFDNGRANYVPILNDGRFGIPGKIDSGAANMVWIMAAPMTGFWEAAMAGPDAYWVNGGPIYGIGTRRRFVILAHGIDREVGLWLEVTAHMTENILNRVSQRWPKAWSYRGRSYTDWQRYQLTEWQNYGDDVVAPGFAQVGTAHFPPNAPRGSNYAFDFTDLVESYADDWYTYPNFAGVKKPVNRETWNTFSGDYHRGFEYWWFSHIPRYAGSHDGILNDWWHYIYEVNRDPDAKAIE